MSPKHTEHAFENAIEAHLLTTAGWTKGSAKDYDRKLALIPKDLFAFIEATQTELWTGLRKQHKESLEPTVLDWLTKALDSQGMLDVLRHGFKFYGKTIQTAFFRPANALNPDTLALHAQNRLVVTRQVRFIEGKDESVDMLFSLNGLPVATVELKNHLTGQNIENAIVQYKGRDPKAPLFKWKSRALVHFAVDPDVAFITTKLAREDTVFLPFNRGNGGGAGNPINEKGHRTAYVWEEVWARESFLDILARFAHVLSEEKQIDGKKVTKETVVFPRYHQLDVVRKLESTVRAEGPGNSYLIQHSAGSGKSNSIAWLAHRLSSLHDAKDKKIFDSVIVVTDRRVLDKQLQDTIFQFEHKQGVVAKIDEHSTQLAQAISYGTPVIITTLQKFPFVSEKLGAIPDRKYAVIVDEAHSSQTGESARHLKEVLAAKSLEDAQEEEAKDDEDDEDRLTKVIASRGKQPNISYFAFTATPKAKTLEVFGRKDADGKPVAFHLYSMRQAIEEGFILDVLSNYTTYKAYYKLTKKGEDDPEVSKKQATKQLARFMSLHPHNIAQKTEVMVEHFRQKVKGRIGGRAKAMVVTSSRLHAVRYRQAFDKYIKEQGYGDIGVLVAFSGSVEDPPDSGAQFTEPGMNVGKDGKHIGEKELPERFASDAFHVLIVANKYQTGFDQPLLQTMFVDKRLAGVQAVQTLSRLNRTCPGKEDTFVLDFVNDSEEIKRSFQPYYEQTTVSETADPKQLYDLRHQLVSAQVFFESEVEAFSKVFYAPKWKAGITHHGDLYKQLAPACDRFKVLDEDARDEFRNTLSGYVKLYSFLSQVMPFQDPDLEKLYTFARYMETYLPSDAKKKPLKLDGEVTLKYYRLAKTSEAALTLKHGEMAFLQGPLDVGSATAFDQGVRLSTIIELLNERFGTHFTRADDLLFEQFVETAQQDTVVVLQALANPIDNFALAMRSKVEGLMIDRMDQNQEIVTRYLNEPKFQEVVFNALVGRIYESARRSSSQPSVMPGVHLHPVRATLELRHSELVEKKFLGRQTDDDVLELSDIETRLDALDAAFYEPIKTRLRQQIARLRGASTAPPPDSASEDD